MKAIDRFTSPARRGAGVVAALLLGVGLSFAQGPAPTARVTVADVIVQGNRSVPTQRIISLLKTRPGGEFNQDTVDEDVRRLYDTKLIGNVQVQSKKLDDDRVNVYFLIAEYPNMIQEIVYQGAKHLKQDELDTTTGLRKGAPLNPIANQMARAALERRYHESGRMFASVDLLEGDKPGDTRVVFNITEGPIAKVNGIGFEGNTFVSDARLNTQVNSTRQFLGVFGGTYNPMMADGDVHKLEEYYKSFGYLDVRVSRELQWDDDHRHVKLIFHINEGPRYRVDGIQINNTKVLENDQLLALSKVRSGDYYNKQATESDIARIKDAYGYRGYGVAVRESDYYPATGLVQVHYDVQERPPAKVGEIKVVGNEVTRQNVVLRQVPLYPGQTLSYPELRAAERNLARLNIFEMNPDQGVRPTVSVIDPDSPSEYKDVLVQVQETTTGSLLFGVGVNSDAGLVGSVVLNERNFDITRWPTSLEDLMSGRTFRGAGQEFRAEAVPGTQLQRYTVSFREPYLFDSQYSLTTSGYYYTRQYPEYNEERLGGRVVVGRRFDQLWSGNLAMRVENVNVSNVPYYAPQPFQEAKGNNFQLGLRAGVTRDSRDSYLRPTEGSVLEAGFEQVFGDFTFPIFTVEGNKYWTTYERPDGSGRHVLAMRSQVGFAGSNTPVFERFYAGGFRSLRGFQFRGVGPFERGFNLGGEFMWLNSLEYQVPILANDQLYWVAFVDSGTVESDVKISDYRVTAGTGLRIVVPMLGPVPIALDFGFPIVKAPQDQDQIFSFWVGFFH